MRNFSKFLCSPSAVVRFSYYKKYQNSIGLNQTEVYFPYIGIQTPAFQGNTVVCAVREVKPLLSGCSGPSPCAFCLTVPEGCCSSYHHISHPSGQQQEAGKKKCVCVGGGGRKYKRTKPQAKLGQLWHLLLSLQHPSPHHPQSPK